MLKWVTLLAYQTLYFPSEAFERKQLTVTASWRPSRMPKVYI